MFDTAFYDQLFPALNEGLVLSFKLIVPSAGLGFLLGLLVGAGRAVGPRWLVRLLELYVAVFRGTPLVTQLMVWYLGLPNLAMWLKPWLAGLGRPEWAQLLYLSPFAASVLAFTLCSGAYHSEYIRGAFLSIGKGQFLAARALGFTKARTFWSIIVPQALRRALPGCGNEIIYLIKYSSLAFIVSCSELTGKAKTISQYTFRPTEVFFFTAIYYLALVTVATCLLRRLEHAFAIPR